jgi:hypothetical protein
MRDKSACNKGNGSLKTGQTLYISGISGFCQNRHFPMQIGNISRKALFELVAANAP